MLLAENQTFEIHNYKKYYYWKLYEAFKITNIGELSGFIHLK